MRRLCARPSAAIAAAVAPSQGRRWASAALARRVLPSASVAAATLRPTATMPAATVAVAATQRRGYQAAYGTKLRSHDDVRRHFLGGVDPAAAAALRAADGADFVARALPLVERV